MKAKLSGILSLALKDFFSSYLPQLRGMSTHTILSYRDSLKLFLVFLSGQKRVSSCKLAVEYIEPTDVIDFLNHLENDRHNGVGTRNNRLAAIHSFFRYIVSRHPEYMDLSQCILNIPFKRNTNRIVEYFEFEEIQAVLQSIDRSESAGMRDYALLLLLFNTGARVHEIVDLRSTDLDLTRPFSVRIYGKGRKERICPIWTDTAKALREYIEENEIETRKPAVLFLNNLQKPLTRFGIRYILDKHLKTAAEKQPSLKKKRLHPHSIRHSTAVHLLKSGVDLSTIANWLGHASINTTNKYATIDLEMKREALAKVKSLVDESKQPPAWRKNPDIVTWLESL